MARRPIRILRIITRLNIGGPAIQAVMLSKELPSDDFESLLVCGKVSIGEGDMGYLAIETGIKPVVIAELGRELSLLDDLKSIARIRRIVKRFRPHIVHTHTAKAGTLGRIAVLSINWSCLNYRRIRTVHTFHGHILKGYFNRIKTLFFQQIERFLSLFTDRIIVISPLQKKDICCKYKIANERKVRIINLGFDLRAFTEDTRSRKILREKYLPVSKQDIFFVGIIGRLTQIKNHKMLFDAIRYLKDIDKNKFFKFIIIGDGELKDGLMERASELGIHDELIFAGWQKEMTAIYSALDAVALTSRNEGTPVTLIEAMALGKPVVATDVGGVPDLMGKVNYKTASKYWIAENGILVPSNSSQGLASGLLFMLENKKMAHHMAHCAKNFVLENYSKDKLISDVKSLYDEIMLK